MQVFKNGNRNSLESYRFVHIKDWMPRVFDGSVYSKMKPHIIENMSKLGPSLATARRNTFSFEECPDRGQEVGGAETGG